jgi:hypothetical protein
MEEEEWEWEEILAEEDWEEEWEEEAEEEWEEVEGEGEQGSP